jgi:hypothetical protein
MTEYMWAWVAVTSALSVSVTINVAFMMRESEVSKLRHLMRSWVTAVAGQTGMVRMQHNRLVTAKYADEEERFHVPEPPPFED